MSANGVILERLSGKKLSILVSTLLVLQLVFFLVGFIKCRFKFILFNSKSTKQLLNLIKSPQCNSYRNDRGHHVQREEPADKEKGQKRE